MTGGNERPWDAMAVSDSINSATVGLTTGGSAARKLSPEQAFASSSRTREQIPKERRQKTIDVLFLLDATRSMEPVIKKVKDKIVEIAEAVEAAEHLELRVGYVAYRDIGITPRTDLCEFTYSLNVFKELLGKVEVHSDMQPGCKVDEPEDVFSALEIAQDMRWQSRVRTIIHIGDAPAHGREFHEMEDHRDNYINGDPDKRDLYNMLRVLRLDNKVNLYIFVHAPDPNGQITTRKMLRTFKQVANADAWWMERELDEMESGLGFVAGIVSGLHTSVVRSNNPHAP